MQSRHSKLSQTSKTACLRLLTPILSRPCSRLVSFVHQIYEAHTSRIEPTLTTGRHVPVGDQRVNFRKQTDSSSSMKATRQVIEHLQREGAVSHCSVAPRINFTNSTSLLLPNARCKMHFLAAAQPSTQDYTQTSKPPKPNLCIKRSGGESQDIGLRPRRYQPVSGRKNGDEATCVVHCSTHVSSAINDRERTTSCSESAADICRSKYPSCSPAPYV